MDKNTVYILQKDLPHVKAGTEFSQENNNPDYYNANFCHYHDRLHKSRIINNPTWFKPKEEVNESKPTEKKQWEDEDDDFLWTNKLAMELCEFVGMRVGKGIDIRQQVELLTEVFKQSKSKKEEPQWEILSFKNLRSGIVYVKKDNGKFNSGNGLDWDLEKFDIKDHEIIHSVKRFPDNTVWSVDMVTEHGIITAFKIIDKDMWAVIKGKLYEVPLVALEEALPKETPKPEWEILKLEIGGVNYPIDALNEKEKSIAKIYSVKRLSDGEVFSVGDVITGFSFNDGRKINRFSIQNGKLWISQKSGDCEIQHIKKVAPKEEQVPIKVEIMEFGYGKPQENKGKFYVANFNLPNNAKLPTEKYQSIKSAIEDVLNEDKIKHEKLLSKIESKVRLANMINTQANYLKETLDYINSLK